MSFLPLPPPPSSPESGTSHSKFSKTLSIFSAPSPLLHGQKKKEAEAAVQSLGRTIVHPRTERTLLAFIDFREGHHFKTFLNSRTIKSGNDASGRKARELKEEPPAFLSSLTPLRIQFQITLQFLMRTVKGSDTARPTSPPGLTSHFIQHSSSTVYTASAAEDGVVHADPESPPGFPLANLRENVVKIITTFLRCSTPLEY